MPKKPTDSRDYGRRLYVGKEPYTQKFRNHTTAHYDWLYKLRQSESKKPYLNDDYPSMEYSFSPWNPVIPPPAV